MTSQTTQLSKHFRQFLFVSCQDLMSDPRGACFRPVWCRSELILMPVAHRTSQTKLSCHQQLTPPAAAARGHQTLLSMLFLKPTP